MIDEIKRDDLILCAKVGLIGLVLSLLTVCLLQLQLIKVMTIRGNDMKDWEQDVLFWVVAYAIVMVIVACVIGVQSQLRGGLFHPQN